MTMLGNGLSMQDTFEDALSVKEAELSLMRRLGAEEDEILIAGQSCESRMKTSDGLKRPCACGESVYSGRREALWRGT